MRVFALKKVVFCTMLVVMGTEVANATTIYGLDNARQFKSSHHAPFTIQAGAFTSRHNAQQLKTSLMRQIHAPVKIVHIKQRYLVMIGPLSSASEVRAVASETNHMPPHHQRRIQGASQPPVSPYQGTVRFVALDPMQPSMPHHHQKSQPRSQNQTHNHNWFLGGDLGLLYAHTQNSMTVNNGSDYPPPESVDQYSLKQHKPVMIALQAGHHWKRDARFIPGYSLSARYQHLFVKDIQGSITQYSLPEFRNYAYHWGVSANVLSLYTKVDLMQYGRIMPYVDAGLGVSINQSQSYQETAYAGVTPRISPAYQGRDKEQLSYNVGAGVDISITPKITMSIGYDYQSFGRVESGNGFSTWSGEHLNLGTLSASTALLGVTYWLDNPRS